MHPRSCLNQANNITRPPPFFLVAEVIKERSALQAIYMTLGSPAFLSSWSSGDPCDGSWTGVNCTSGFVTGVSLQQGHLSVSRPLDPAVGDLTHLTMLGVSLNINGTFPTSLSTLTNLQSLALQSNSNSQQGSLSGIIPPQLSTLVALRVLVIGTRILSGSIPPQLSTLTALSSLQLNGQLLGEVPSQLSALTNLNMLDLSNNYFNGSSLPHQLSVLVNLRSCSLQSSHLQGVIPPQLSALTALKSIYLTSNFLTGSIPAELSAMVGLNWLQLNDNLLTGSIAPALSYLGSNMVVTGNAALCGSSYGFLGLQPTGTRIGQACPMPPCEWV